MQSRRLDDALRLASREPLDRVIDYGAGDGDLALRLMRERGAGEVLCFEPAESLRAQLACRIGSVAGVSLVSAAQALPARWAQLVVCLEVFEHLPAAETDQAITEIHRVLAPGGALIVGVPVEVGPMALAKGAFRFLRRPSAPDARWSAILAASFGRPPAIRPTIPLVSGSTYYSSHLGFDHRVLVRRIQARFHLERMMGSPLPLAPTWLQSELYLVARKRPD